MTTGVQLPFWPLWLADWGLTPAEIGLYTALGMAVRVVAGLAIPALADRLDQRRLTIVACAAAGIVLYLAHLGIHTRPLLLAATLAVGAVMAGIGPIAEALGVAAARVLELPLRPGPRHRLARLSRRQPRRRGGDRPHRRLDRALVRRHLPRRRPRASRCAIPARARSGARSRPTSARSPGWSCTRPSRSSWPPSPSPRRATRSCTRSARALARARPRRGRDRRALGRRRRRRDRLPRHRRLGHRGAARPGSRARLLGPRRHPALGCDDGRSDRLLALADPGPARADLRHGASRRHRLHRPRRARPLRRGGAGRDRLDGRRRRDGARHGARRRRLPGARRPHLRHRRRAPRRSASASPVVLGRSWRGEGIAVWAG